MTPATEDILHPERILEAAPRSGAGLGLFSRISAPLGDLVTEVDSATFKESHTCLTLEGTDEKTGSVFHERLEASLRAGIPDPSIVSCGDEMATQSHRPCPIAPRDIFEIVLWCPLPDPLVLSSHQIADIENAVVTLGADPMSVQ